MLDKATRVTLYINRLRAAFLINFLVSSFLVKCILYNLYFFLA